MVDRCNNVFPHTLALIPSAVSEKTISTDGRTDDGRPRQGSTCGLH